MSRVLDLLHTDLRHLIADLGKDGGQISPSVYDTAQYLRLAPPAESVWPSVEWLLAKQGSDGGWGSPSTPIARDIPTLAAILALHSVSERRSVREAVREGMAFIRRQASLWSGPLPVDIPLGAELILPSLLDSAAAVGLPVPDPSYYATLRALGARRLRLIEQQEPRAGSPASHSWEAWGTQPDSALLDVWGSVGHSPAATAAWLRAASSQPRLAAHCEAARDYLRQAAHATGCGIPGVVPTVWPYPRNEQAVSLFSLLLADLLHEPALAEPLNMQINDLWQGMRPDGQGISDEFQTDGDITAMCLAITRQAGYKATSALLQPYLADDHCLTYPQELQRSLSATAHAAHALTILGDNPHSLLDSLCAQRTVERIWDHDKWHTSWTYITGHAISALIAAGREGDALAALPSIFDRQQHDGGWGTTEARDEETANVVSALLIIARVAPSIEPLRTALTGGATWLMQQYRPLSEATGACWAAKDPYRPRRIARTLHLGALLGCFKQGFVPTS